MKMIFFLISLLSSVIGSICGIGGGIIIKPAMDFFALAELSAIGFYSSCTVLSMSAYNVARAMRDGAGGIDRKTGTPLAAGAALGGIAGGFLFTWLKTAVGRDGVVGAVQSALLLLLTIGTMVYTLRKSRVETKEVRKSALSALIGVSLGCISSFLGIGGGPFNLVVLHYFYGMDTKKAVANSLYIILFSQAANLLLTVFRGAIPAVDPLSLLLMLAGGIGGGAAGRAINRRISARKVDGLFMLLLSVICLLCLYNGLRYLGLS